MSTGVPDGSWAPAFHDGERRPRITEGGMGAGALLALLVSLTMPPTCAFAERAIPT
jgi:hypothetical protein